MLSGTTQAVDIIHGGVKSNALPELAEAIVNVKNVIVSSLTCLTNSLLVASNALRRRGAYFNHSQFS